MNLNVITGVFVSREASKPNDVLKWTGSMLVWEEGAEEVPDNLASCAEAAVAIRLYTFLRREP